MGSRIKEGVRQHCILLNQIKLWVDEGTLESADEKPETEIGRFSGTDWFRNSPKSMGVGTGRIQRSIKDREMVADFIDGLDDKTRRKLLFIHSREELEDMSLEDIVRILDNILYPSIKNKKELRDLRDTFGRSEYGFDDDEDVGLLHGL